MKVFLHIGTDKTGSTAIQNALFHAAESLRKIGVHYPTLGTRLIHHEYLVDELLHSGPTPKWNLLIEYIEKEKPNTIILSSEKFCNLKDNQIGRIQELFKGAVVEVICYLRPADQYLESGLLQRLRTANSRKQFRQLYFLAKWVPAPVNPAVYIAALRSVTVFRWAKYFSNEQLHFRPYDKDRWVGQDLIADFLRVCEINLDQVNIPVKDLIRNATPDIFCIYICHILKATGNKRLSFYFAHFMARENVNKVLPPITSWPQRAYCRLLSNVFLKLSDNKDIDFNIPAPPVTKSCFSPSFRVIERKATYVLAEFLGKHSGKILGH